MRKYLLILLLFLPFLGHCTEILSTAPGWGDDVYVIGIKEGETKISSWISFTICSGSGTCALTSMSGHSYGDVANITAGTYSFGDFENLLGITLQPLSSAIHWSGEVLLSKDSNCVFAGGGVSGTKYGFITTGASTGIQVGGTLYGLRVNGWDFESVTGNCIDASTTVATYDGVNDYTMAMRHSSFNNLKVNNCDQLLQGTFAAIASLVNIMDSITFTNLDVRGISGMGYAIGVTGLFRLLVDGATFSGDMPGAHGDVGLIDILGNFTLRNIVRTGGFGYIARIVTAGLGGIALASYMWNIIDYGSNHYGTVDVRSGLGFGGDSYIGGVTPANFAGGDLWVINVTDGNKQDTSHSYTTVLGVVGNMAPYGQAHFYNCFSFNTVRLQASPLFQVNTADPIDSSHNLYWFTAAGNLIDTTSTWMPLASPLLNLNAGGLDQSTLFTTDVFGNPRGGVYGRGAVVHESGIIPPQTLKVLRSRVVNG